MKILMIINARSGVRNSKAHLLDAMDVFSKYNHEVHVHVTQKVNDAYEYLRHCRTDYDVVCVFGGDGTLNEVTNALIRKKKKPRIGYFPSGTMNDFGSNFNLDIDFRQIAENICNNKPTAFDVGKFNDRYFNYVAAFGAFCDVPFSTDRNAKETFGTLAYIFEGISRIPDIKPIKVSYTVKDKTRTIDALFGLVFSGGRVAGVQLVDKKKSRMDDGMFNILIVEYVENIFEMPDYLAIITNPRKYFHQYKAQDIVLAFEDRTIWTLDGERADVDRLVNISCLPRALEIIA